MELFHEFIDYPREKEYTLRSLITNSEQIDVISREIHPLPNSRQDQKRAGSRSEKSDSNLCF